MGAEPLFIWNQLIPRVWMADINRQVFGTLFLVCGTTWVWSVIAVPPHAPGDHTRGRCATQKEAVDLAERQARRYLSMFFPGPVQGQLFDQTQEVNHANAIHRHG